MKQASGFTGVQATPEEAASIHNPFNIPAEVALNIATHMARCQASRREESVAKHLLVERAFNCANHGKTVSALVDECIKDANQDVNQMSWQELLKGRF